MAVVGSDSPTTPVAIVRVVSAIMGTVVGLTFLFGFGNVLNLALRLGVPVWVAPLVAPAVDLSILGLLLGIRHLALAGVSAAILKPARRLLIFASVVTLALNVADPVVVGAYGKAAFDAVGPLLLIGWAEVGPSFLQAIGATSRLEIVAVAGDDEIEPYGPKGDTLAVDALLPCEDKGARSPSLGERASRGRTLDTLLVRARQEDLAHRAVRQRPISADTLRVRMRIGAETARRLVKIVRAEFCTNDAVGPMSEEPPLGEARVGRVPAALECHEPNRLRSSARCMDA